MKSDPSHVVPTSVYVVLQDYEQETCFILMFWALAIIGYKGIKTIPEPDTSGQRPDSRRRKECAFSRKMPMTLPSDSGAAARPAGLPASQGIARRVAALQFDPEHSGCVGSDPRLLRR